MTKPLAVITGASSGIGEATAKLFSEAGYPTLLLARRIEIMESFNLKNSICKKVDVRDRDALVAAATNASRSLTSTFLQIEFFKLNDSIISIRLARRSVG